MWNEHKWQKLKRNWRASWWKWKRGVKSWLKTQHSKSKDHGIQSHHFMANRWGKKRKQWQTFFLGLQNHCRWCKPKSLSHAQSCSTLCNPMDCIAQARILQASIWSGQPFPYSGDLPNSGLKPGFPHCRKILYQLSHKGRPRKLAWVAYPFSSRSS